MPAYAERIRSVQSGNFKLMNGRHVFTQSGLLWPGLVTAGGCERQCTV